MNLSEAEAKTDGANEKQACRNFIAGVMIGRCGGANALRAMQGAFAGDKPGKMLSLYESVVNSQQNEGVEQRLVIPFENLASNHMMNIANPISRAPSMSRLTATSERTSFRSTESSTPTR